MRIPLALGAAAVLLAPPASAQLAPPNADGIRFAHVHLNVSDVALNERLWTEIFDGVVVRKGRLTMVRIPNVYVLLRERAPSGPSHGSAMDHFGLKVRDLDEILAACKAKGLEVQPEFTGAEGFRNAYVLTPDGSLVELQEDPTLTEKAIGYHVHFWTGEHVALMNWYAETFGAVVKPRGRIQTAADVPGMNLSFQGCPDGCVPSEGRAIDHIGFEVEDLEGFVARLEARGVEMQVAPRPVEGVDLRIAFFVDPSGVRVELTHGLDEP